MKEVCKKVSFPACTGLLSFFWTGVAGQVLAVPAVLNGLRRTMADTGHAVGTMVFPYGSAVFQMDILKRTDGCACSAGNTAGCGIKLFCVYEHRVEEDVYDAAVSFIAECNGGLWKRCAAFDAGGRLVDHVLCLFNDL